jgi:hypothetical protein
MSQICFLEGGLVMRQEGLVSPNIPQAEGTEGVEVPFWVVPPPKVFLEYDERRGVICSLESRPVEIIPAFFILCSKDSFPTEIWGFCKTQHQHRNSTANDII